MTVLSINYPSYSQRGVASLLISLVLLVSITMVTLYTSRTVLMENKIATNEFRGRMAFEAAEKGIESTYVAIQEDWLVSVTEDAAGNITTTINETNVIFDINGDGEATGNSNTDTLANGSTVTVAIDATVDEDLIRYDITSTGVSDDNTARRVISTTLVVVPAVPNTPDSPLLARGSVVLGGSATVINPEGHSTIWAGSNINIGSNNSTKTEIANPQDANYPDCLGGSIQCGTIEASNPDVLGLDVIGNDNSLNNLTGAEFFYNFLGDEMDNYKETRADIVTTDLATAEGAASEGQIIWAEGNQDIAANSVFGAKLSPALVIVEGNLDVTGNVTFNGMLYITGSIVGTGSLDVTGAVVVNGIGTGGGSVDVVYNSQVLALLNMSGGRPAGSSGTWRDFQ